MKRYPESFYTIYRGEHGELYHTDGNTCWVETGVTVVDGDYSKEIVEYLPVMDMRNQSVPLANVTSMHVNKAIQRSVTKALGRHGLGLSIYYGEEFVDEPAPPPKPVPKKKPEPVKRTESAQKIYEEVDALISSKLKSMSADERKPYIEKIKAVTNGVVNYANITDEKILKDLLAAFKEG